MTLTKHSLAKLSGSMLVHVTKEQEALLLGRFSAEPEPYVWNEQDIAEQLRQIVRDYPAGKAGG